MTATDYTEGLQRFADGLETRVAWAFVRDGEVRVDIDASAAVSAETAREVASAIVRAAEDAEQFEREVGR